MKYNTKKATKGLPGIVKGINAFANGDTVVDSKLLTVNGSPAMMGLYETPLV